MLIRIAHFQKYASAPFSPRMRDEFRQQKGANATAASRFSDDDVL